MHEAERYLRNADNPSMLYVMIGGKRRRLFINRDTGEIGIIAPRRRRRGYLFCAWNSIGKVCYPTLKKSSAEERERRLVLKYRKMAEQATFRSPYLRKVMEADPSKSLFENHLTTGSRIDGKVISLKAVRKWCGEWIVRQFMEAVRECRRFDSGKFNFRGYDGSLWVEPCEAGKDGYRPGDLKAGFSCEYRGMGNGYYYLLINDDNLIGYDID